jgi:TolB-like protein
MDLAIDMHWALSNRTIRPGGTGGVQTEMNGTGAVQQVGQSVAPSDRVSEELKRILKSKRFRRSERMRRYLEFLVGYCLEHRRAPSAREIGENVFDRPDLDSRTDPIIRVEAARLRRFLNDYAAGEGASDPLVISLSSPGYAPVIRKNTRQAASDEASTRAEHSRSVAVLPFVNMTNDPNQEVFCEGVKEELVTALSRHEDVKVLSRASTLQFNGPCDIRQVGGELGVSAVIEGSVRVVDDHVRVTAQLTDTHDGFHLCSETFDAELEQSFNLQERLATQIAAMTRETLPEVDDEAHEHGIESVTKTA